jgi:hypothetical protein
MQGLQEGGIIVVRMNEAFGATFTRWLRDRGLSTARASYAAGGVVSGAYIANWKKGLLPRIETFAQFLSYFEGERLDDWLPFFDIALGKQKHGMVTA